MSPPLAFYSTVGQSLAEDKYDNVRARVRKISKKGLTVHVLAGAGVGLACKVVVLVWGGSECMHGCVRLII